MLGFSSRQRERVCVWRCVDIKLPMRGRWVGRDAHVFVLAKSAALDGGRGVDVRYVGRRKRMSMSSCGRGDWAFVGGWSWSWLCLTDLVLVGFAEDVVADARSKFRNADLRSCAFALRRRDAFSACINQCLSATCSLVYTLFPSHESTTRTGEEGEVKHTSFTASLSLCAGCIFVEPFALRICFASVVCRAAKRGLLCRIVSSMGGSIVADF